MLPFSMTQTIMIFLSPALLRIKQMPQQSQSCHLLVPRRCSPNLFWASYLSLLRVCSLRRTIAYAAANRAAGSLHSNRRRFYNYYSSSQDRERHRTIDTDAQQPPRLR